jgi:hypothetical protein
MVKHIRTSLDNDAFERLNAFRNEKGWTWEELLLSVLPKNDVGAGVANDEQQHSL